MIGKDATKSTPQPPGLGILSDEELRKQAAQRVQDEIAAAQAPIDSARKAAAARALANRGAISGAGAATSSLMGDIGSGIQSGYSNAAAQIGGLAGGFSSAAAERVRAAQAANDAFVQSQVGKVGPSGVAPDATNLQDSLYAIQGFTPASSLAEQGAAANAWGAALPAIHSARTEDQLGGEIARANTEDQGYAQQLIDLAAKSPAMRTAALDELYRHELEKLNARLAVEGAETQKEQFADTQAESKRQFDETQRQRKAEADVAQKNFLKSFAQSVRQNNVAQFNANRQYGLSVKQLEQMIKKDGWEHDLALRGMTVQEAAQKLYEEIYGNVTLPKSQADIAQGWAEINNDMRSLGIRQAELDIRTQELILEGARPDVALSRVMKKLVDSEGNTILIGGKEYPVTAATKKTDEIKAARQAIASMRGKPVENPNVGTPLFGAGQGKWLAADGARGAFPARPSAGVPRTTNDPTKAKYSSGLTFAQARAQLMAEFDWSATKARAALVNNGWKPDGKRP